MLTALALVAAPVAASTPVSPSPTLPIACQAAELAMRDQFATMQMHFRPGDVGPGPLGLKYQALTDRLAKEMTAAQPDLERVAALMREVNQTRFTIMQRQLANRTECQIERLKLMPVAERNEALRRMAPPTQEQLKSVRPVAPPPPPRPPTPKQEPSGL